jgi:tetratricopeptide (TPR) repeat protein
MVRRGVFVFTAAMTAAMSWLGSGVYAQSGQDTIFSPQTAEVFIQTAKELIREDSTAVEPAMRFLDAAEAMDRNASGVGEQRLRIGAASCTGQADHSAAMVNAMRTYVSRQFDVEVVAAALRCVLTQLDTRVDREAVLEGLLNRYASVNATLGSELATQLGLLAVEKTDTKGAQEQLNLAYSLDPYNQLAFDALQDLYAGENQFFSPAVSAMQIRMMLDANPYNLSTAMRYAELLRRLELYPQAAAMYEYADRVFSYHFPNLKAGQSIYLPWILSCYHSPRLTGQCLELADRFRDEASFDLMLEAAAGRAAARMGRPEQPRTILEAAAQKAEQMLGQTDIALPIYPEHLAWFFSFILERPDNALAWSNQAFSQAPERRGVKAIFAYTLALNGQYELAEQYAQPTAKTEQIAAITMAIIRRHAEARETAIELLRDAIALGSDSFEAEKARSLLADMGSEYLRPTLLQDAEKAIESQFGGRVVPTYLEPRQRFSSKLMFSGSDVFYGADMDPRLVIENNSSAPLVIRDGAMLAGYIRVDVRIRGDISMDMADVFSTRFRPSRPIQPNEHIFIPLDLRTGKLGRLLMSHPQASVDLEFTVYLDPVENEDGTVVNALSGTSPVQASLRRRGVTLTRDFLMQRLDALAKGQEGQKLQAAAFFAGLLAEQGSFERVQVSYAHTQVERDLLVDAVRRALTDDNWRLRVHTMAALDSLMLPADFALIQTLSGNLNHKQWPVRFITLHLLSRLQKGSFQPVLDWTAQYDANNLNRRLAVALGGKEPPQPQKELTSEQLQ